MGCWKLEGNIGDLTETLKDEHIFYMNITDMRISVVVEGSKEREIVENLAKRFNLLEE